jgi:hypothetical protein
MLKLILMAVAALRRRPCGSSVAMSQAGVNDLIAAKYSRRCSV